MRRHDFTQRLLEAAFDLRERLEEANMRRGRARLERLVRADEALARLRLYVRLASRLGWLTAGQNKHAAELTTEIGSLLGGWQRATSGGRPPAAAGGAPPPPPGYDADGSHARR